MGIYKMALSQKELSNLYKVANTHGQSAINQFNYDEDTRDNLKKTGWVDYIKLQATYLKTHYGKYTLAATVLATSAVYLGAVFFAPTLLPFAIADISTTWLKWTVVAAVAAAAVYFGGTAAKSSYNEFFKLVERFKKNELSNYDVALLATVALSSATVVGMMYAFPNLVSTLSTLSTWPKAATASAFTALSAVAGYAAFFGRPTPPTGGAGASTKLDADDESLKSGMSMVNQG
jgi:hypothetical protein